MESKFTTIISDPAAGAMIESNTPAHDAVVRVLFAVWTFAAIIVGAAMGLLFGLSL